MPRSWIWRWRCAAALQCCANDKKAFELRILSQRLPMRLQICNDPAWCSDMQCMTVQALHGTHVWLQTGNRDESFPAVDSPSLSLIRYSCALRVV
jgi:hypothetical protein